MENFSQIVAKAKEAYKKGDERAINAVIAMIAAYLAKANLSSSESEEVTGLKAKLNALRNK